MAGVDMGVRTWAVILAFLVIVLGTYNISSRLARQDRRGAAWSGFGLALGVTGLGLALV
jgi:hypothetical protein